MRIGYVQEREFLAVQTRMGILIEKKNHKYYYIALKAEYERTL